MAEQAILTTAHVVPIDVEDGPEGLAEIDVGEEVTQGRPCVLIEHGGRLAIVVDGTGPALYGCSPSWLRGLAQAILSAADEMERTAGDIPPGTTH